MQNVLMYHFSLTQSRCCLPRNLPPILEGWQCSLNILGSLCDVKSHPSYHSKPIYI